MWPVSESINNPELITLALYPRAIAHIDCDAFFASCEQARDPSLRGKPVVTGKERGIVSCASYEAKARGVKRGVSFREIKRLCPETIILPSDYETYSIFSERVFAIIRRFTPEVEESSIDEAFCDLTGLRRLHRTSYANIARKIKQSVADELGIIVSVGLSITKTLAKICSKKDKPDGFLAIPGRELHEFLGAVELKEVCGFGPNTVALLNKNRIFTALDFVKRPVGFAGRLLGKIGVELWRELRGEQVYHVLPKAGGRRLSISKTKTFAPPSSDKDFVKGQLMRNMESAFIKLRRHRLSARRLAIFLRERDYKTQGLEARINRHSSSTLDFTDLCSGLFEELFRRDKVYRSTGVIVSGIVPGGADRYDLFDDPVRVEQVKRLAQAVDKVNGEYGKHTLHLGASNIVNKKSPHARNELTWRKRELLKGENFRKRLRIPLLKLK